MTYDITEHSATYDRDEGLNDRIVAACRMQARSVSVLHALLNCGYKQVEARLYRLERTGRMEKIRVKGRVLWAATKRESHIAGHKALSRSYDWKPLSGYTLDAHRQLALAGPR